jgi:hypothetical protein
MFAMRCHAVPCGAMRTMLPQILAAASCRADLTPDGNRGMRLEDISKEAFRFACVRRHGNNKDEVMLAAASWL